MFRPFAFMLHQRRCFVAWLFALCVASSSLAQSSRTPRTLIGKESRASASSQRSDGAQLRRKLRTTLSQPLSTAHADIPQQVLELVELYRQTAESPLTASERGRWRARLRSRLAGLSKAIARNETKADRAVRGPVARGSNASSKYAESRSLPRGAAGGASQSNAQELIELIQTTIAPPTWEVNGGRGTISYWEPGLALVVRQTDDVHDQIGGALRLLGN